MSKPLLCRWNIHISTFTDSSACYSAQRCNRCDEWVNWVDGAFVEDCRRLMAADMHPQRKCYATDALRLIAPETHD